jgi:hypothetical protein
LITRDGPKRNKSASEGREVKSDKASIQIQQKQHKDTSHIGAALSQKLNEISTTFG